MKKLVLVIVVIGMILVSRSIVHASDGDLDASWGGTGVVVSTHATESAAYAIANYPDNRVLVVGSVTDFPVSSILVTRFLVDGSPDTTCNNTGQFVDTVNDAVASDVVVLSDGSFVVAGTMQINNKGALFVAKFTNTCNFDPTFGNNGIATYLAGDGTSARALTVQSDGKIIVVGDEYPTVSDSNDQRILVARFSALGIIDNSFGTNGRFISTANQKGQAQDVVIDSSGRIIFTGSIVGAVAPDAAIVGRLTSNGQLDSTFATLGYFINEFNGDAQLDAIDIRPNGNLVAIGTHVVPYSSGPQNALIVCLTDQGALDSTCNSVGWDFLSDFPNDVYADDVFVTSDNRILLSGASDDGNPRPFVIRLNHNGTLDNNFATSGTWRGTSLIGRMYSVTIQSDGRILAAGRLDAQGTMSVGVVRLANTVVTPLTTTTTTTIAANQLPATGRDKNGLMFAVAVFGLGILLLGMRRRALR
ncbi:MAG: hypothetical protein RL473_547 [Actinomycetota bacterium]